MSRFHFELQFPVGIIFLLALLIVACESVNPISKAETLEQRAYATYGTYVIFAERAASLAENESLPNNVRLGLVSAEERAKPVVDSLLDALLDYEQSQTAGAEETLRTWVERALPVLEELVASVKGAQ